MFAEARSRVQAIAGIRDFLLGLLIWRASILVLTWIAWRETCFRFTESAEQIQLTIDVDHTSLEIGQGIPLGLIVNGL